MFKKFFQKSPKNEEKPNRDPYFKNNVTAIPKPSNLPHHSSSHSPFRNETSSQGSYQNNTKTHTFKPMNTSSGNLAIKSDKIQKPNFENNQKPVFENKTIPVNPPDMRESFTNMMGSISEHVTEGNHLVQTLPSTKDVWASKIPISDGFNPKMAFKIVNKDTGFYWNF